MKKEFLLNIVFLVLANLLIKPLYLLWIEVRVNNIVGTADYGIYAGLFSLCYIFQIIVDPGLLNYNTTQIAAKPKQIYERLTLMLGIKTLLAIVFIMVVFTIAFCIGYEAIHYSLLPWIAFNLILISLNIFLRSNISAIGKYRWDSLFSVLDKLLLILVLYFSIQVHSKQGDFTILDFAQGQSLAFGISSLILLGFLAVQKIPILPRIDWKEAKQILQASLPYAYLLFLMTIYTRVDSFMLERMISDQGFQAGIYARGFRLYDAGNSFSYLFAVLLLPMFSSLFGEKKSVLPLFKSSFSLMLAGLLSVTIYSYVWAEDILEAFYPGLDYSEMLIVFRILIIALIPISLAYISGTLLTAKGALRKLNQLALWGVGINIVLNIVLIQYYQAKGAAIATCITQGTMTLLQFWIIQKMFNLKFPWFTIARFLLYAVISIIIAIVLKQYSPLWNWTNFIFGILSSLFLAFILSIINLQQFTQLLKRN